MPWQRVLWKKQPYEDNYVHESFLHNMQENANVKLRNYWDLVGESAAVSQQVSTAFMFVAVFHHCLADNITLPCILAADVTIFMTYIGGMVLLSPAFALHQQVKDAALVTGALLLFSPVFRTLTLSFAEDTIWASSIALLMTNVAATDYTWINGLSPTQTETGVHQAHAVALNAAVFSSVLLCSRLPSPSHTFALLAFAFLLFALLPSLRGELKRWSPGCFLLATWSTCVFTLVLLSWWVLVIAATYLAIILSITFIFPAIFVYLQRSSKWQIS
eukprot:gene4455-4703_t